MVSGEKRNCEGETVADKATALLVDVEGTTTSISFVKDTLFPYVRENLKSYVDGHWDDEEFKGDLKALKEQAKKDVEEKLENACLIEDGENEKDSLVKNVLWQMDLDRKTTALKQLQGHVWREGYENGKLKGHVFSDVPVMLKKWCEEDRKVYIYSSGSVEAQKLLFKNSEAGDLETYLTGHFDTEMGPKTEASSYTNIAKAVGYDCCQMLFLTDSVKEAVAADKAGLQVTLVVRDGNAPLTEDEKKAFTVVTDFNDLVFEASHKKKKMCEEGQETDKAVNVEGEAEPETDIVVDGEDEEDVDVDVGQAEENGGSNGVTRNGSDLNLKNGSSEAAAAETTDEATVKKAVPAVNEDQAVEATA